MTKSNSSATLSTSNLYEHPWFSQLKLLDDTTICGSQSQQKPKSETPGQKSTKYCPRCKTEKPRDQFNKATFETSGLQVYCRICSNQHNREVRRIRKTAPPRPDNCECCGKADPKLFLDHADNKFRGWLCNACNAGIGALGDNLEGVARAITYLQTHGNEIQNSVGAA